MKKIIITGHTGFLGSHLVDKLSINYDIIGISKEKSDCQIKTINKDIRDISLKDVPEDIFCIIHLAAISDVDYTQKNPKECFEINLNGTQKMLDISKEIKSKFLFVSTSHVYGNPSELPLKETSRTNPFAIYAASKLASEILCKSYHYSYDIPITILRLFSVYGPKSPPHLVTTKIISQMVKHDYIQLGNLDSKRDFIYIDDVIQAFEICLENITDFNIFNVGSEKSYSIGEICDFVKKILDKKIEITTINSQLRKNDIQEIISDCTMLKKLNWAPQIDIEEGLKKTITAIQSKNP